MCFSAHVCVFRGEVAWSNHSAPQMYMVQIPEMSNGNLADEVIDADALPEDAVRPKLVGTRHLLSP